MPRFDYYRLFGLLVTAAVGVHWAVQHLTPQYSFIDGVNVLFHEAGHPIFGIFGNEFLMVLGGTLGQLLMPAIVIAAFMREGRYLSAAVTGFWLGESFMNISIYCKDSVAKELPMVGLGDRIHDWEYILDRFGRLMWCREVGNIIYGIGVFVMVAAFIAGLIACVKSPDEA